MNPISKAIMDVKAKIPPQILDAAFVHREYGLRRMPVSVDALIRDRVINPRVLVDCNLVGGTQVIIPMSGLVPEYIDPRTIVFSIPLARTQGRKITRVLSMGVGLGVLHNVLSRSMSGTSSLLDAADAVVNSHANVPAISTAFLRLVGENTVMVTDQVALPSNLELRCFVENDEEFSTLRPTAYAKFSRLVELAVKAYIFNEMVIPMGQGQLVGGMELGRFREIIDGYADANELYDTYLEETWRKVALLNDPSSYERHLRIISGGRR